MTTLTALPPPDHFDKLQKWVKENDPSGRLERIKGGWRYYISDPSQWEIYEAFRDYHHFLQYGWYIPFRHPFSGHPKDGT